MNQVYPLIANRLIRLSSNIVKMAAYPFHWLFPKLRFTIPNHSKPIVKLNNETKIPRIIWQTNFTNKASMPLYINYLFNRLMSLNCEYRYMSTEDREIFIKEHSTPETYSAYMRLNNGAAQADLWRLVVLNVHGGVYMDIDATLVWSLNKLLVPYENSLYIKVSNNTEITNYFIASRPNNPELQAIIDKIVYNINNYKPEMGVYGTTGPDVLNQVLDSNVDTLDRKYVCIQGTFTNEHFQYIDRPRSKWTHMDPKNLVK